MPRRKSKRSNKPLKEASDQNIRESTKDDKKATFGQPLDEHLIESRVADIVGINSLLDNDENKQPGLSAATLSEFNSDAAALYDELDSFRQRWKRELQVATQPTPIDESNQFEPTQMIAEPRSHHTVPQPSRDKTNQIPIPEVESESSQESEEDADVKVYNEAKKLFLQAVELEQDDMHHESIKFYKKAMHLYPDIEKQIFLEQLASTKETGDNVANALASTKPAGVGDGQVAADGIKLDLCDRIRDALFESSQGETCGYFKPQYKSKQNVHISELPHELILHIFRFVVGQELDLASLESAGMVCRGFYLISRDQSIWRSICYNTWGSEILSWQPKIKLASSGKANSNADTVTDWRKMYIERPRVNYDGVYISRTRYIRQGDVGFQDITYRPFHVVRYYRYLRFFPDKRVLILTTNEEPDKIIPIFRHALHSKQFSSELSILEGTFEFFEPNVLLITADKDCRAELNITQKQRRNAHLQWSRQTPLSQKFTLRFELRTYEHKPYRNNVLKWLEYAISSRLETGQEMTDFDLTPDTFPNLMFCRVKKFNLRLTKPLASH